MSDETRVGPDESLWPDRLYLTEPLTFEEAASLFIASQSATGAVKGNLESLMRKVTDVNPQARA